MKNEKEEVLKRLEPLIDEVLELIDSKNDDLMMGTILRWNKEAEKENIDALAKIGMSGIIADVYDNFKVEIINKVILEDGLCPECKTGNMERYVENCSCHIDAPCSACENALLKCCSCSFEIEYENDGVENE
jgi:hypothetical protein